jgi:hypothetical protein
VDRTDLRVHEGVDARGAREELAQPGRRDTIGARSARLGLTSVI